ncbi:hypothetical protein BH23ACT5_BH23ACT5_10760 [soil metagenome]
MNASHLVSARLASTDDLDMMMVLYRGLEAEMAALHPMWPRADGLPEPAADALRERIEDPDSVVVVGEVAGVPLGFLVARVELLLAQADYEQVGVIRLVYTDHDAREVGVAEVMRDLAMEVLRQRGVTRFDAHVLPGHRLAKNFFEAGGFSARSIVMHHDDSPGERPSRDPRRS